MAPFITPRIVRRNRGSGSAWIWLLLSFPSVLGACGDGGSLDPFVATAPQLSAASIRAVESRGRSWAVNPADPFACFSSVAAQSGPIKYLYRRQRQEFPARVLSSTRAVEALSYRVVDQQGKTLWVLNCTIPASERARAIIAERFRLWESEPDPGTVTTMGCVTGGACELPGITTTACKAGWMGDYPDCYKVSQVQCGALDPSCGGFGGGGDPGAWGSGGGGPCTDCGPSTPILACSTVQRGGNASCEITANGGPIPTTTGWTFTGGGLTNHGAPGMLAWGGIAVQSGQVSAALSSGNTLQAMLVVTARAWRWQRGGQLLLSHGTAPLPPVGAFGIYGNNEWVINSQALLGWNCTRGGCGTVRRVQPDVTDGRSGYAVASVPSGPNATFWYVASITYKMDRETNVNPNVLPGGVRHQLLEGPQAVQCRTAMGLAPGTPVWVNLYEFNKRCVGSDIDGAIQGMWRHEELGSNASGDNGHEGRAYYFAAQPAYDPYLQAGDLVFRDESTLRAEVVRLVKPIQDDIERFSGDHTYVKGNWTGYLWLWDALSLDQFVRTSTPITGI